MRGVPFKKTFNNYLPSQCPETGLRRKLQITVDISIRCHVI